MATLAETAARKALETARTQAALAVAEADKATEAAMNRMHLLHMGGMTYQLGDTEITAGPVNNESVENLPGKTEMIVTSTTEKLVGTEAGSFLQSEVPSPDGNTRLIVVSQYAKPKKANVYYILDTDWVYSSPDSSTEAFPYGRLYRPGKRYGKTGKPQKRIMADCLSPVMARLLKSPKPDHRGFSSLSLSDQESGWRAL